MNILCGRIVSSHQRTAAMVLAQAVTLVSAAQAGRARGTCSLLWVLECIWLQARGCGCARACRAESAAASPFMGVPCAVQGTTSCPVCHRLVCWFLPGGTAAGAFICPCRGSPAASARVRPVHPATRPASLAWMGQAWVHPDDRLGRTAARLAPNHEGKQSGSRL